MLLFMVFFLHLAISCKQSCSSLAQSGNNIIDKRQLLLIIYIYILQMIISFCQLLPWLNQIGKLISLLSLILLAQKRLCKTYSKLLWS